MSISAGNLIRWGLVASLFVFAAGCAKTRKAGGHMDTPEVHYKQGMKYFDQDQIVKAEEEFNLANSLDKKFGPAYAGLALTTARKASQASQLSDEKKGFAQALSLADKACGLSPKDAAPFIAKGMVITMQFEGKKPAKEWIDNVESEFSKALKNEPSNAEAYYRRGYAYKKAFLFSKAKVDFSKVIELNTTFTSEADREFKIVNDIERAAPGTDIGKKIALIEKLSRADICALFIDELKIDKLVTKKRPKKYDTSFEAPADGRTLNVDKITTLPAITDMANHWAKNFVGDIVDLGIRGLEPYPDHTFKPDELVNRGEYAIMVEDAIIAVTGDESIATKNSGQAESRFPDVNSSHPAYNAICTCVDRGIMAATISGEFGARLPVSGPDALLTIRQLKNFLKIE